MVKVATITQQVRDVTGGISEFEVQADSVRGLIAALEARYPGLGELITGHMAIAIDGELHQDALSEALTADSEVVLVPRIAAG